MGQKREEMFRWLCLVFLAFALHAETVDTLIDKALAHHDSLKTIERRLEALDAMADKSRLFADPELSLSVNDIQFDDPLDRSLEPMQFTAVNVKQKFPWFGKRDAATGKVEAQKALLFASLEAAQAELAMRIRRSVYTVSEYTRRLALLDAYLKLARQQIELNAAYVSTQAGRHMGMMSAELVRAKLDIRREKLDAMLKAEKARLSYLVQAPVGKLDADETVVAPPSEETYLQRRTSNRGYHVMEAGEKAAAADVRVKKLSGDADPFVKVGYYHREAHPDYLSFTVGAALPIYGAQSDDTEAARKKQLAAAAAAEDYRAKVVSEIKAAYASFTEAYRTYRILTDESVPLAAHMVELSNAKIRGGSNLFAYFDLLERKLGFDEQLVAAKADYLRARARLKALTGEIR
jgi:outer membrane protein, heavy metal efflux system